MEKRERRKVERARRITVTRLRREADRPASAKGLVSGDSLEMVEVSQHLRGKVQGSLRSKAASKCMLEDSASSQ